MGSLPPRFLLTLLVPVFLIVVGTVGFHFLEEHSWTDSLYFAVITLTTVGYGDFAPRTTEAKISRCFW